MSTHLETQVRRTSAFRLLAAVVERTDDEAVLVSLPAKTVHAAEAVGILPMLREFAPGDGMTGIASF